MYGKSMLIRFEYPGYGVFMRVRISEDEVQIMSQVQHNVFDKVHRLECKRESRRTETTVRRV